MSSSRHREIDVLEYLGFLQKWRHGYDGPWPGDIVRKLQVTPIAVVRMIKVQEAFDAVNNTQNKKSRGKVDTTILTGGGTEKVSLAQGCSAPKEVLNDSEVRKMLVEIATTYQAVKLKELEISSQGLWLSDEFELNMYMRCVRCGSGMVRQEITQKSQRNHEESQRPHHHA